MLKYTISIGVLLFVVVVNAQTKEKKNTPKIVKDTTAIKYEKYGLRIGVDLSKPIRSLLEESYSGLEWVGDYRWSQNLYLAAEIGKEKRTATEDFFNYTSKGNYLKAGINLNSYNNWYGMQNNIYFGFRYAFGQFSQELNSYTIYNSNPYFREEDNAITRTAALGKWNSLNAQWLEIIFGLKTELFSNVYLGTSLRIGYITQNENPSNFRNLWIPGFQKVTENSNIGFQFNYTISYRITFYHRKKKEKKSKEKPETKE